jgi:hypothetical protein
VIYDYFVRRYYRGSEQLAARRDAFLRGEGPAPLLDPVAFFSALGLDPELVPEAVEQIRRDRDRLIDDARD